MASETQTNNRFRVDVLMPVLTGIVLVSIPLYTYLAPLVLWYVFMLTVWSILVARGRVQTPGAWLRFVLAVLVIWSLYYSYGVVFGLIPGTSMVILLSYLKLFEIKSQRDITVLIFVGYFLASSVFFHSQSIWVALYVFVLAIYFTSLLVLIADRKGSVDWRERLRYASRMVLQSLPLMLIMFVLFPRIPGPLWALPKDAQSATTGLSEEMTPGNINKLVASYDVAYRVKFEKQPPENKYLYWRGLVLSNYDGKTWRRDDAPGWTEPDVLKRGNVEDEINYKIYLEPHNQKWLYSLELITGFDSRYAITRELQLFNKDRVSNVISYRLSSSLHAANRALYPPERRKNLELPAGYNPETIKLGRRIRSQAAGNDREMISRVLRHFSENEFFYTLAPPILGENAMDDFLFRSRRGFCEHYASAFVTLMRAAGLPARVVLGYQGGELNPVDDYMIVRQSDAHAWTEVWVDNQYWQRVDPTMAVAPQRIERGIVNAGLEAQLLPRMLMLDSVLFNRARFAWDSFQNGWNQWVVGFNEKRQIELFRLLGIEKVEKSSLMLWLVVAMSVAGLLVAWWVIRFRDYERKDRVRMYYHRFRRRLASKGIDIAEQDTPQELLTKVRHSLPASAPQAAAIVEQYQALMYGQARNRETEKTFVQSVRRFRFS
jgi:transglutaminase-like putative cysteine protease